MNWTPPGRKCRRLSAMLIIVGRLRPESVVIDPAASVITDKIRVGLPARPLRSAPCRSETIRYWSLRMRCRSEPSPMYLARQNARACEPQTWCRPGLRRSFESGSRTANGRQTLTPPTSSITFSNPVKFSSMKWSRCR